MQVSSPFWLLASAAVLAVGDLLVRPLLGPLVTVLGPLVTVVLGVAVQLLLLHTALTAVPGLDLNSFNALWQVYFWTGLVGVVVRWLVGSNDSRWVVRGLLRHRTRRPGDGRPPGLLVVQVDGLSMPLLQFGLHSGTLTTIARWLRQGSHLAEGWRAQLPSTTPASQAGLLHGSTEEIPAFRWWDPELRRVLVANRPADAAVIERRVREAAHAAGRTGLLAGDGASIGNLFSGEAAHAHLVVSTSRAGGSGRPYLRYVARPFLLLRSLILTLGEIVKELYQGWQQRVRRIEPRIPRRGWYVLLRALTNALLRDLNVSLVAQALVDGRPSSSSTSSTTTRSPTTPGSRVRSPWTPSPASTASCRPSPTSPTSRRASTGSSSSPTTGRRRARRSPRSAGGGCRTSSPSCSTRPDRGTRARRGTPTPS